MLKVYRKIKYLNYGYYNYSVKVLLGKVKNKILFKEIMFCDYKVFLKSYINIIFCFLVFCIVIYCVNIKITGVLCVLVLFLRYICSFFDKPKIKKRNKIVGEVKHIIFTNKIKISLNNELYEIYSHGGNYFSVMKGDDQIALINTNGKVIMNELCFMADCVSDCNEIVTLFIFFIDTMFYGYKIGRRSNRIFSQTTTLNFSNKHKERLYWSSKKL